MLKTGDIRRVVEIKAVILVTCNNIIQNHSITLYFELGIKKEVSKFYWCWFKKLLKID